MSTPEDYKPKKLYQPCKSCAHYPNHSGGIHLYTCEMMIDIRLVENTYVNCSKFQYVPGSDVEEDG